MLVTPLTWLLAVVPSWPEPSVPPPPSAAELLESGSATATAPPAPPISRPAASRQTPKAKRKCDRPTICSPSHRTARQHSNVCNIVAWSDHRVYGDRKLDTRGHRSAANHSYDAVMSNPRDQAALTMPRSAATPGAKPVERQPEAGWIGGPAQTTAAVHQHRPVCLRGLRSYFVHWMSRATSPRTPDYQHQLRPRFVSLLLVKT